MVINYTQSQITAALRGLGTPGRCAAPSEVAAAKPLFGIIPAMESWHMAWRSGYTSASLAVPILDALSRRAQPAINGLFAKLPAITARDIATTALTHPAFAITDPLRDGVLACAISGLPFTFHPPLILGGHFFFGQGRAVEFVWNLELNCDKIPHPLQYFVHDGSTDTRLCHVVAEAGFERASEQLAVLVGHHHPAVSGDGQILSGRSNSTKDVKDHGRVNFQGHFDYNRAKQTLDVGVSSSGNRGELLSTARLSRYTSGLQAALSIDSVTLSNQNRGPFHCSRRRVMRDYGTGRLNPNALFDNTRVQFVFLPGMVIALSGDTSSMGINSLKHLITKFAWPIIDTIVDSQRHLPSTVGFTPEQPFSPARHQIFDDVTLHIEFAILPPNLTTVTSAFTMVLGDTLSGTSITLEGYPVTASNIASMRSYIKQTTQPYAYLRSDPALA